MFWSATLRRVHLSLAPGIVASLLLAALPALALPFPQTDPAAQERSLRQAVRDHPEDAKAQASLGTVLAMQNKLEEGVPWLEKALKANPRDAETRRTLATAYWQLGQAEKARTNLVIVLRALPGDGWSTLLLGMVSEELGDHAEAARLLHSMLPRVRQRVETILSLARAYYATNEPDKARQTLGYLAALPDAPQAQFKGGRAAADFRDYATAEAMFRAIQYSYPDPAEVQLNLALAQYAQQHYDDSQKTLLASVESGRANANTYELLGWTYQQQNRLEDMMKAFEKAINMEPGQESHFLELGQALLEKRNAQTALEVADEAIKRFPNSSRAWSMKGASELRMSRLTDAEKSYAKAVELGPDDAKAALGLALTYWNASQEDKATAAFSRAAARFPRDALIQLKYAIFLTNSPQPKGDKERQQIKSLLERSEQLDGSIAETHFNLGNIAVQEEKYDVALNEFEATTRLDPGMSKAHFALARVYRRLGREDAALKETEIHKKLKAKEELDSDANAAIGAQTTK